MEDDIHITFFVLLAWVWKMFAKLLIDILVKSSELEQGKENCSFRQNESCKEKIHNTKVSYSAFMDLEKACDSVERDFATRTGDIHEIKGGF